MGWEQTCVCKSVRLSHLYLYSIVEFTRFATRQLDPKPGPKTSDEKKKSGDTHSHLFPDQASFTCTRRHPQDWPARTSRDRRATGSGRRGRSCPFQGRVQVQVQGALQVKRGPRETLIGPGRVMRAARYQARTSHKRVVSGTEYKYEDARHTHSHAHQAHVLVLQGRHDVYETWLFRSIFRIPFSSSFFFFFFKPSPKQKGIPETRASPRNKAHPCPSPRH